MDSVAAEGLVVRPSRVGDGPFLQGLYQAARPDLQWIDGEHEQVQQVIAQQFQVQEQGLGENFPNAMHYVVEKLGTAIGALSTDFGPNEIRVLYLAFIPQARGQGYGRTVLQGAESRATDPLPGGDRGLDQQSPRPSALPGAGFRSTRAQPGGGAVGLVSERQLTQSCRHHKSLWERAVWRKACPR